MESTRRNFLKNSMLLAGGLALAPDSFASFSNKLIERPVCVFSKCLQFLDYDAMAEVVAKLGFEGVDLTVRPHGHVLPENATVDLPKVVKAMQTSGLKVHMMATEINDPDDKYTEQILGTASDLGIEYYRLGRFVYDLSKPILENLDQHKRVIEQLEKINRKYKIRGEMQNHSGPYKMVGGPVWDLHYILKEFDPEYIGVQYDIMHGTAEGPNTWRYGYELIAPWIGTLDFKDFIWNSKLKSIGTKKVPLGEGLVDYEQYFELIRKLKRKAPVSIHYEYNLGGAEIGNNPTLMTHDEIYTILKKDLTFIRKGFNS